MVQKCSRHLLELADLKEYRTEINFRFSPEMLLLYLLF